MLGSYDLLVLAALGVGYVFGRVKGFAWQVSGIATLVVGFVAAAAGSRGVARFFPDAWPDDLRKFAAWSAIYAGVSIAIYLVTLALSKKLKQLELEDLDRRFGGALGALKAGLILGAVSLVAVAGSERARDFVRRSASGPILARIACVARPLLPAKVGEALDKCVERIDPNAVSPPAPRVSPSPSPEGQSATAPHPVRTPVRNARSPEPRETLAPQLDGSHAAPRPSPVATPAPRAKPSPAVRPRPSPSPDFDEPADDDEDMSAPAPHDSGRAIEPEPESPPPRDPLLPR